MPASTPPRASPAAALFHRHVFVDLETTGLDPRVDRVMELGALFVERGVVTARLSRLFDPGMPVPAPIAALTGITTGDVTGRPRFESCLPELRARFAGWTVVAHNAEFERGFFAGALEEIGAPVLDSCELLHYLHPELPSHSLDALVRWARVGDRARHRALPDCEDTFAVLCFALAGCVEQRRLADVMDLLACLGPAGLADEAPEASQPPLVALLSDLATLCFACEGGGAAGLGAAERAVTYEERAPLAYVRAYLRRGGDEKLSGLSSWFKRRFPALVEVAEVTTGPSRPLPGR